MVVLLDHHCQSLQLNGHTVLNLYDRRFATGFRDDQKSSPWTPDIEQQYQQFVLKGDASDFVVRLDNNDGFAEEEGDGFSIAQDETYLYTWMRDFYETETEVYNTLRDSQGEHVLQLFACVTFHGSSPMHEASVNKYADIPGILLQYIDGFPLTDIAAYAPREAWQPLCEQAIRIVHHISDRGILNEDVKTRSFINQNNSEGKFKKFMLDFALCNFRRGYKNEEEWWE